MRQSAAKNWIKKLGYQQAKLHMHGEQVDLSHPYSREINALLNPEEVGSAAVIDFDQIPVVCFIDAEGKPKGDQNWLDSIRQKIWNQNLVSLVLVVDEDELTAYPIRKDQTQGEAITLDEATSNGPYSVADISSGEIQHRHPDWFAPDFKVDADLLHNLKHAVLQLESIGVELDAAQYLLGQCLFVSYLEHRSIVSEAYRTRHNVMALHKLIASHDTNGLAKLFRKLKSDFNGDFLEIGNYSYVDWKNLSSNVLGLLNQFLNRVNLETGQGDFWHYDFRYIPVELISGIYETFLGDSKEELGAYYTPRHLANLAVDQAFSLSKDISKEIVFDGACGSGILLTTAFRRMIGFAEAQSKKTLSFNDRREILINNIRGSDINNSACTVTAFSLYLALLEDLQPSDIVSLQDDENTKLPRLLGTIIQSGDRKGEFFSNDNKITRKQESTIFLSNPPWYEPSSSNKNLPYEVWANKENLFLPQRQIAAAFAYKSLDSITKDGLVCLILPVKLFNAPTSQKFISHWLTRVKIKRVINFSDIRRLLFSGPIHPCVVVTATVKNDSERGHIKYDEWFDYWVPKADVSLAFGRLSVHSADRRRIFAQDVYTDNSILRTCLWGDEIDLDLITRLKLLGSVSDMTRGKTARWKILKGFNQRRHSSPPLPVKPLLSMGFLDARSIPREFPVLDPQAIEKFPADIKSVVSYGSQNGEAFNGPRVLFPDGTTPNFEVCAVFASLKFCFKHTIAAIKGPNKDANLLRFLTMYLRSDLVRYILLNTAYSLTVERPRITLKEVEALPFVEPDKHPDTVRAQKIVNDVSDLVKKLESFDLFDQNKKYSSIKRQCEKLISKYFGLKETDQQIIKDYCDYVASSIQPAGYNGIWTPYYQNITKDDLYNYTGRLNRELENWQSKLGGRGHFHVETVSQKVMNNASIGITKISVGKKASKVELKNSEKIIINWLEGISNKSILPMPIQSGAISLGSDFLIHLGKSMYLIKPLSKRLWLQSQAIRDAHRIISSVQVSYDKSKNTYK